MGLPCGTEALDPITPQYLGDLIAWSAIGARTTESQTHREMASGLSSPVGFKNGTDGNLEVALNAMLSAAQPHTFLGINGEGQVALTANPRQRFGHLILRGGAGAQLRLGGRGASRGRADDGQTAGQHRGRLQPRQLAQKPCAANPGAQRRGGANCRWQPAPSRA